jgi:hypothetical protein
MISSPSGGGGLSGGDTGSFSDEYDPDTCRFRLPEEGEKSDNCDYYTLIPRLKLTIEPLIEKDRVT